MLVASSANYRAEDSSAGVIRLPLLLYGWSSDRLSDSCTASLPTDHLSSPTFEALVTYATNATQHCVAPHTDLAHELKLKRDFAVKLLFLDGKHVCSIVSVQLYQHSCH